MKVVLKMPGEKARQLMVTDELKLLQQLVGGFIEPVNFAEGVTMLVNEEGKIMNLKPNFRLWTDLIVGNAVFVGTEGDEFCDCPMSPEEIEQIIESGAA